MIGMAEWLTSSAAWPSHQRTYWNDVVQEARNRGWTFRAGKGHVFGTIACRPTSQSLGPAEVCSEVIYRTGGKNSEKVAKQTIRFVRSCPHKVSATDPAGDAKATSLLDEANVLMDGAEKLIAAGENFAQAAENLIQAEEQADAAELLLQDAVAAEDRGLDNEWQGQTIVAGVDPALTKAPETLEAADTRLSEAEQATRRQSLLHKIKAATERLKRLKSKLPLA